MGASRFELEPTPIFSCSSQMELALSHRTRMFLAPDTVGVEIPTRKFSTGELSSGRELSFGLDSRWSLGRTIDICPRHPIQRPSIARSRQNVSVESDPWY